MFRRDFLKQSSNSSEALGRLRLLMMGKWEEFVYKGKDFGPTQRNLSKVLDNISYELLITKPNAYGFSLPAIKNSLSVFI